MPNPITNTNPHHQLLLSRSLEALNSIILGKKEVTELALATMVARGSILIEDRPGLGKTTLAKALAKIMALPFQRVQCTNDLLPMDVLGRMDLANSEKPRFIPGPIFGSIVLLDELNRAPARTQSAFLQAMEEGEISLEGQTLPLPKPQLFIATQNPFDQVGTSLLPESELDRFTIMVSLGVPDASTEIEILKREPQRGIAGLVSCLAAEQVLELQKECEQVTTTDAIYDLVVRLLNFIRSKEAFVSPRAGRDLIRMAQAIALIRGQSFVSPDEVKAVMLPVIQHRVKNAKAILQKFSFQS